MKTPMKPQFQRTGREDNLPQVDEKHFSGFKKQFKSPFRVGITYQVMNKKLE
jgi:hypothetical protein